MGQQQQRCLGDSIANSSIIKSMQAFSISMGSGVTSNTATISSVTAANSVIIWNNYTTNESGGGAGAASMVPGVALTNGTSVTCTKNAGTYTNVVVGTVVEFIPGVIKSNQSFTITI